MANIAFKTYVQALTNKTTPTGADSLVIVDSADSNNDKETTVTGIYNYIKSLTDVLYQSVLVSGTNIKTINSTSLLGSGDISISSSVADGDKGDITVSGSGTVWNIDSATVGTTELSATGTPSASTFLRGDNTWATPAGSGDVSKVGTPANNQVGVWTGDGTIEGDTNLTFDTATDTLTTVNLVSTKHLNGSNANFTDFPNTQAVFSQADTGEADSKNIGIVGEAQGHVSTTAQWGVGVYGVATTNAATSATGVTGEGKVTASGDTAPAIGVRGYATTTHSGGRNIALYANASGSSTNNLALEMVAGDIQSDAAQTWTLVDNTSSALSISSTGKADILKVVTTDAGEGITMSGTLGVTGAITNNGVTVPTISSASTLTNKRVTQRVLALSANSATPAINTDLYDVVHITNQTAAITSFTSSLTGTPVDGDKLRISVTGTAAVALTWGASFEASTVALPTTTVSTTRLDMGFLWNSENSKWRIAAVC